MTELNHWKQAEPADIVNPDIKSSKYSSVRENITEERTQEIMRDFVEVELTEGTGFYDAVNAIKSIGMMNESQSKMTQTCHVFKKRGKIFIVHFKQLLALDARLVELTEQDLQRVRHIAQLMESFGYVKIINPIEAVSGDNLGVKFLLVGTTDNFNGDMHVNLLKPSYDNIQLEKKYTFD